MSILESDPSVVVCVSPSGQRLPHARALPGFARARLTCLPDGTAPPSMTAWLLYGHIALGGDGGRGVFGVRCGTLPDLCDPLGISSRDCRERLLPQLQGMVAMEGQRDRAYRATHTLTGGEGRPVPRDVLTALRARGCTASAALLFVHYYANSVDVGGELSLVYHNKQISQSLGINEDTVTSAHKSLVRLGLVHQVGTSLSMLPWWREEVLGQAPVFSGNGRIPVGSSSEALPGTEPSPALEPIANGDTPEHVPTTSRRVSENTGSSTGTMGRTGLGGGSNSSLSSPGTSLTDDPQTGSAALVADVPVQALIDEVLPVDQRAKLAVLEVLGVDLVDGLARGDDARKATRGVTPAELHRLIAEHGCEWLWDLAVVLERTHASATVKPWLDIRFQRVVLHGTAIREAVIRRSRSEDDWKIAHRAIADGRSAVRLRDVVAFLQWTRERQIQISYTREIGPHWKAWKKHLLRTAPTEPDDELAPAKPASKPIQSPRPLVVEGAELPHGWWRRVLAVMLLPGATGTPEDVALLEAGGRVGMDPGIRLWLDTPKMRMVRQAGKVLIVVPSALALQIISQRYWANIKPAVERVCGPDILVELVGPGDDHGNAAGAIRKPPSPAPATHADAKAMEPTAAESRSEAIAVGAG